MKIPYLLFIELTIIISPILVNSQIPAQPDFDDNYYYGFEYGAAGIANSLMSIKNGDNLNFDLNNLLNTTMNKIWENRLDGVTGKVASWSKYPGLINIYPGIKYGSAGILETFLKYYAITNDTIWLDRSIEIYDKLAYDAIDNTTIPHWSYQYQYAGDDGIALSDLKFGSTGILKQAITLFQYTGDIYYIEHGMKIVDWLKTISIDQIVGGKTVKIVPWYYISDTNRPVNLGYNWGLSGVVNVLYKFGVISNSNEIKNWALDIADYIASEQQINGAWYQNIGQDYIINDFDEGMAGILFGLEELQRQSKTDIYVSYIKSGIKYLFSNLVMNSSIIGFYRDDTESEISFGFINGLLGILHSLISLHEYLDENQLQIIINAIEWLITVNCFKIKESDDNLIIMISKPNESSEIIDFSLADGLAGLLFVVLELKHSPLYMSIKNVNLDFIVEGLASSFDKFQADNGFWRKQNSIPLQLERVTFDPISYSYPEKNTDDVLLYGIGILFILFIIMIQYRRRIHKKLGIN